MCPLCQVDNKKKAAARWRASNRSKCREYQRKYKAANPDYQRRWALANPEKVQAASRRTAASQAARDAADPEAARRRRQQSWSKYRAAVRAGRLPERFRNPELQRRDWALRRARKYGVAYEEFPNREIFDRDDWVCQLCSEPVDPDLRWPDPGSVSLDHILALSRGGGHVRSNVQTAHIGCNWRKFVNDGLPEAA